MFIKKYITNISGLQFFQLLRFGTLLLISIILAKSGLTTSSIGTYEMFLFLSALFSSFWINGLIQAFLPLYRNNSIFDPGEKKTPEAFNAFMLISLFSLIVIVILIVFHKPIALAFSDSASIPWLGLLLVYILLSSPSFLVEYIYLLHNQADKIILYGIITFFFQIVFVATPILAGYDIETALWGFILISFFRYIWLVVLIHKYSSFNFSIRFIKEHLYYAYPLILSTLLGSSATYVDGFLVMHHFDAATFAIFRYGAKEFPLVLLMANALSTAMIPAFSNPDKIKEASTSLKLKSKKLMHLLFPSAIIFIVLSDWLYPLIFNPDFSQSATIFKIYLLLTISRLIFPHTLIIGLKKSKVVLYASMAELFLNILLSIVFVRLWGIEGIAFATVIAFAFQKLIWLIYNKKVLKVSPDEYIPVKPWIVYTIVVLITFIIMY